MQIKLIGIGLKQIGILLLFFVVFLISGSVLFAQNDCDQSLLTANAEYQNGQFLNAISILEPCLANIQKDAKYEAYRLMAICHLNLNNDSLTDYYVKMLLKSKTDYREFPFFDPTSLTKKLSEYDVWPRIQIGFKAGFNLNSVRVIKNYSMTNSPAVFNPKAGFSVGVFGEYYLRRNRALQLGLIIEGLSYNRTANNVTGFTQEYEEKLQYFSLPLSINQRLVQRKMLHVNGEVGFNFQFLTTSNSNIFVENPNGYEKFQHTGSLKDQRNKLLVSPFVGLTFKYDRTTESFFVNVRYAYGLSNVVNPDKRYNDLEFSYLNEYIDSDIAFIPINFTFGYQRPLKGFFAVEKNKNFKR